MTAVLTACSGFLLAVLWMDLIFDVQVLRHRRAGQALPEPVLSSITGYYHRATTTSRPMSHLIVVVMLVLLGALAIEIAGGHRSGWLSTFWAVLAVIPIGLAVRTVRDAVRLGARTDDVLEQSRLARSVCRDHIVCFACMASFLGVTLLVAQA
jgi:hypothetical protein